MKYKTHRTRLHQADTLKRRLVSHLVLGFCSQSFIVIPLNVCWPGTCKHHIRSKSALALESPTRSKYKIVKSGFFTVETEVNKSLSLVEFSTAEKFQEILKSMPCTCFQSEDLEP